MAGNMVKHTTDKRTLILYEFELNIFKTFDTN